MILYFSGTGNSRYAALRLHAVLGGELVDIGERLRRRDFLPLRSPIPFVLVAPTYAWGLPKVVEEWLRRTPLAGDKRLYAVLTCGGSCGGAERKLRRLAAELSLEFRGLAEIPMPENYIAMYTPPAPEEAEAQLRQAETLLEQAARRMEEGRVLPRVRHGLPGALQTGLVNPLFYRFIMSDRKFRAGEDCVGCGRCAELCPLSNISLTEGRPRWGGSCTHCMACICACPVSAIEYGRASVGRRRYYLDEEGRQRD